MQLFQNHLRLTWVPNYTLSPTTAIVTEMEFPLVANQENIWHKHASISSCLLINFRSFPWHNYFDKMEIQTVIDSLKQWIIIPQSARQQSDHLPLDSRNEICWCLQVRCVHCCSWWCFVVTRNDTSGDVIHIFVCTVLSLPWRVTILYSSCFLHLCKSVICT